MKLQFGVLRQIGYGEALGWKGRLRWRWEANEDGTGLADEHNQVESNIIAWSKSSYSNCQIRRAFVITCIRHSMLTPDWCAEETLCSAIVVAIS